MELQSSICHWLVQKITETKNLLEGNVQTQLNDIDNEKFEELDLLPIIGIGNDDDEIVRKQDQELIEFLQSNEVPNTEDAIIHHSKIGAFKRAARLILSISDVKKRDYFEKDVNDLRNKMRESLIIQITNLQRKLQEIGKVDTQHHNEIQENVSKIE